MTTATELTQAVNDGLVILEYKGERKPITDWYEIAYEEYGLEYNGKPLKFIQSDRTGYEKDRYEALFSYDGLYYVIEGGYSSWDGTDIDERFYPVEVVEKIVYVTRTRTED